MGQNATLPETREPLRFTGCMRDFQDNGSTFNFDVHPPSRHGAGTYVRRWRRKKGERKRFAGEKGRVAPSWRCGKGERPRLSRGAAPGVAAVDGGAAKATGPRRGRNTGPGWGSGRRQASISPIRPLRPSASRDRLSRAASESSMAAAVSLETRLIDSTVRLISSLTADCCSDAAAMACT